MKARILITLLLLCLLFTSCESSATESPTEPSVDSNEQESETQPIKEKYTMNVMTFNCLGAQGETKTSDNAKRTVDRDSDTRGPKLKAMLEGEAIDIAGLQELKSHWRIWIRKNLTDTYGYVGTWTQETEEAGYVLYRKDKFTPIEDGVFWLVDGTPTEPAKDPASHYDRMCVWVIFQIKETGEYFLFCDTHLDTVDEVREGQAKALVGKLPDLQKTVQEKYGAKNCPVILVGDMNSEPDTVPYQVLTSQLRDSRIYSEGTTVDAKYSTSPEFRYCKTEADYIADGHVIDYILVSRAVKIKNYKMIHASTNLCPYGAYISDHNAVIAQIQL